MVLKKWDDEVATDYDINGMFNECLIISGLNLIRELLDRDIDFSAGMFDWWGDAYIDTTGQMDSVDTAVTSAEFDTDKYKVPVVTETGPYFIIEATSLTISDFAYSDCEIALIGVGKWILTCDTGTDEVKRAKLYKVLFYGTDGTNPRVDLITGLTALKSSNSDDSGKRVSYFYNYMSGNPATANYDYTGTFADTTTNNDCQVWSYVASGNSIVHADVLFPSSTVVNTATDGGSDETEVDTSGDVNDNPDSIIARLSYVLNYQNTRTAKGFVLHTGAITWVKSGTTEHTVSSIDFYVDNSIPLITTAGTVVEEIASSIIIITHDLPAGTFNSTISSAIGVPFIEDYEAGADIQYKLTGTAGSEDTGWLDCGITPETSSFTAFTAEPDTLIVKLTDMDAISNPIGEPSFETVVGWSATEVDVSGTLSQSQSATQHQDGSNSWKFTKAGDTNADDYLQISRTVDFSHMEEFSLYYYKDAADGDLRNMYLQVLINDVSIINQHMYAGLPLTTWTKLSGDITKSERGSYTLKIRLYTTSLSVDNYDGSVYIDTCNIVQEKTSIKGFVVKAT